MSKKRKYPIKAQPVIEKDSKLGTIALETFALLVFGFILVPIVIMRADGIIDGFVR